MQNLSQRTITGDNQNPIHCSFCGFAACFIFRITHRGRRTSDGSRREATQPDFPRGTHFVLDRQSASQLRETAITEAILSLFVARLA